jgi:hypothetical protein
MEAVQNSVVRVKQKALHHHIERSVIKNIEEVHDRYYVTTTNGSSFAGIMKPASIVPEVGQKISLYLHRGSSVRGVDLDGKELFFKTDEELEVERQEAIEQIEAEEAENKIKFDAELANPNSDFNKRLAALPKVFRQRFRRFFRLGDGFWAEAWYELVACETAIKIAYACKSLRGIRKFKEMSYGEQTQMIPTIDDGLSGNQFGFACAVAGVYLRNPKLVIRVRGALSPLVGSKPYIGR